MDKSKFGLIITVIFLLVFVELAILYLREEVSLFSILEVSSVALVALFYYFIITTEVKIGLKSVEEGLIRVEERFENVEKRFEKVEMSFHEDIETLKKEVKELRKLFKETTRE